MPSSFFGLSIGRTGVSNASAGINTTAHNAANATTEGYSRQVVTSKAGTPVSVYSKAGMQGSGVTVESIERQRSIYYDEKYRTSSTALGKYETNQYYLQAIENYFNEVDSDSKGITYCMNQFFSNLENLKNNPSDSTTRTAAVEYANNFTEYVNYLANSLQQVQKDANEDLKITVQRVNSIAAQIATLNKQINTLELESGIANDLRDQRDLLIDELSSYGNITVSEVDRGDEHTSLHEFTVLLDGAMLVDTYNYNTIELLTDKGKVNQGDADGLYTLRWSNGMDFNMVSPSLGGKLQALLDFRDGNDGTYFNGTVDSFVTEDGDIEGFVVKNTEFNDYMSLNIADEKGKITLGARTYLYDYFDVDIAEDGTYQYTFHGIKNMSGHTISESDEYLNTRKGKSCKVGYDIDYKGIPYYQAKLNTFVRTFSKELNSLHNMGQDMNGDQGLDIFAANNPVEDGDLNMLEEISKFRSNGGALDIDDTEGSLNDEGIPHNVSYYRMTALNYSINDEILDNVMKVATTTDINQGVEGTDILSEIIKLRTDTKMFMVGTPSQYLESFTADVATDTQQAIIFTMSQDNICKSIDQQRMSISSVDEDEEAMNLVKYQNAYKLSAKVVSNFQDIYDVLMSMV
ncbi:MAG: flagellar hook-associated protein FlgK [Lachnospiraceae bacterium]|nr:flagellar hook-associated protein FlgK [Lachnospiraceae bacterium]